MAKRNFKDSVVLLKKTPKKRPNQHAKHYSKRKPHRKKPIGQGK